MFYWGLSALLTFDLSAASHCSSQDCPEGSKDFREEQCSQFDGTDFQGKRYKWLPYYGGQKHVDSSGC